MSNLENEIEEWKKLLKNGRITEETYYNEIQKIESRMLFEKTSNHRNSTKKFFQLIIIFFGIMITIFIFSNSQESKIQEEITSLEDIPEPIQINVDGSTKKDVDGKQVNINYIASYVLSGKVVDVQEYYGSSLQNKLSPLDVGIAWGFLAEDSDEKVTWTSNGTRFLRWRTKDMDWYNKHGGEKGIGKYWSNNHLIPSDDNVEKLIKSIKKGDYVKIEGYLVKIRYDGPDGEWFKWNSSTTRNDTGDGACEVIYVTDVVWLKEE